MEERKSITQRTNLGPKQRTWRKLVLPTLLTVAVGSIGSISAKPIHLLNPNWVTVNTEPVQLDSRTYHLADNTDVSVAKLGVSPYYFVQYNSPDGHLHWVSLANKKGSETVDAKLPIIDPIKHSVRFVVTMKDHRKVSFDETKSSAYFGVGSPDGKRSVSFKALGVPREGVKPEFHPADVASVELQVRSRK